MAFGDRGSAASTPPPHVVGDPNPYPGAALLVRVWGLGDAPPQPPPNPALAFRSEPPPQDVIDGRQLGPVRLPRPQMPVTETPLVPLVAAQEPAPPFDGLSIVRTGPAPPIVSQQRPGVATSARAEPPHPDLLGGAVAIAPWGLVQPVVRPTPSVVAIPENPPPDPGTVTRPGNRPPHRYEPTGTQLVVRGADLLPDEGRATVGTVGFGVPRRPARPLVAVEATPISVRTSVPPTGGVIGGKPPPPNLIPQQIPGRPALAQAEEPPPFPGLAFARIRPLVPSERLRGVPLVARSEEPPPFGGGAALVRVRLGHPPPARFACVVARAESALPFAGLVLCDGPAQPETLAPQQQPGRVLVASAEPPRPDEGKALVMTGLRAGARPPDLGCACGS